MNDRCGTLIRAIGRVEMTLAVILLAAMSLSIFMQVLLRYIFRSSIPWVEEFSTAAFVWIVMLGAGIALKARAHLTIDFMPTPRSPAAARAVAVVADATVLVICLILAWTAIMVIPRESQVTSMSLPFNVPRSMFFSVPTLIAAASMALTSMCYLVRNLGGAVEVTSSSGGAL